MPNTYRLVGVHKVDGTPVVLIDHPTLAEAEQSVIKAKKHDPDDNWNFYVETKPSKPPKP